MHNKIIKYALVLLATASSIFAWTEAETIQNCYTIENERTRQCETILPGEISTYNGEYNTISNIWNFDNNDLKVLWLKSAGGNNLNMGLFWNNGKLYNIWDYAWLNPATGIGETKYVCKVNSTEYQDIGQYCGLTACGNNDNRCNIYGLKNFTTPIETFIEDTNTQTPTEYIIMYSTNASSRGPRICAKYNNFTYCIAVNPYYIKSYKSDIMTITEQGIAGQGETLTYYSNMFQNSPFAGGGNGGGSNTQVTQYSCPTIQQLINTYGEQYNTGLCYSSTLIYSGGTIQTIEPKTIFELYPTYTGFTQAINLYYNYCTPPATQETCNNAFEGNELGRTIINKLPSNAKNSSVYQYCNLQLNYEDKNATTCTLQQTGILAPGITINDIVNEIGNQDITVVTPGTPPEGEGGNGSGSVFDDLIGENTEDTERRNVIENAKNIVKTLKELYAKFTAIFRGRSGTEGFIPEYITGMLLLIILYKLFKK